MSVLASPWTQGGGAMLRTAINRSIAAGPDHFT